MTDITYIQELAVDSGPNLMGPVISPVNDLGVPTVGLVHQLRFAGATKPQALTDDVTGATYTDSGEGGAGNSLTVLGEGGVRIDGYHRVAGPAVNLARPFTIGVVARRVPPGTNTNINAPVWSTTGFMQFIGAGASDPVAAGDEHRVVSVYYQQGGGSSQSGLARPYPGRFGQPFVLLFRSFGDEQETIMASRTGGRTGMVHQYDMAGRGVSGLEIGNRFTPATWGSRGTYDYDLFCHWDRPLSDGAVARFIEAGLALAESRGR